MVFWVVKFKLFYFQFFEEIERSSYLTENKGHFTEKSVDARTLNRGAKLTVQVLVAMVSSV